MSDTLHIFVGTDQRSAVAEATLVKSIEMNCSGAIEVHFMRAGEPGWDNWKQQPQAPYDYAARERENTWMTQFSCFRFVIPELMKFKGRAIYLDVDMLVLGDLRELLDIVSDEQAWGCVMAYRTDVSVINCERFSWDWWMASDWMRQSDWNVENYISYLGQHAQIMMGGWPEWDCLDGDQYDPDRTKLVHYTDMNTQPWKPWPDRFSYAEPHPCPEVVELWNHYQELAKET